MFGADDEGAAERPQAPPVLLSFPDVVVDRVERLHGCFEAARAAFGYRGAYRGVFPVKSCHSRPTLSRLLRGTAARRFGLEVGTKAELAAALAVMPPGSGGLLVCNGVKDWAYVALALRAVQLGLDAVLVLEDPREVRLISEASAALGVAPKLGLRAKLTTQHTGHFGATSGSLSKFGMEPLKLLDAVHRLEATGLLPALAMLHFHLGSQVADIRDVKDALREASNLYAECCRLGAPMGLFDVGGGLGIDFGEKGHAVNYTPQNYANDVVAAMKDVCRRKGVAPPTIVTESGTAVAAHGAVLVAELVDDGEPDAAARWEFAGAPDERDVTGSPGQFLLSTFREVLDAASDANIRESFTDAKYFQNEAAELFKLGVITLEERAAADYLFAGVCAKLGGLARRHEGVPSREQREVGRLLDAQAPYAAVNLSVFRSLVDAWALGRLFPVMPLQGLGEVPRARVRLADITCDSDGKLDRFIGYNGEVESSLPVHGERPGEGYLLGVFLVGVYQESLGSFHNMCGTTNAAHIVADADAPGGFSVWHAAAGQTVADMLAFAQHAPDLDLDAALDRAVAAGRLAPPAAAEVRREVEAALAGSTYLQLGDDGGPGAAEEGAERLRDVLLFNDGAGEDLLGEGFGSGF